MTTTHLFWYLARSAGFLAYLFSWGAVVLGLLMTTRLAQRIDRATQYILHRLLGLGSVAFLGIHLYTLFLDPWANFSARDLFVPFAANYRPFWMCCGILAAYLLVAIAATSIVQQRLPRVVWRSIHGLSFLTFFVGLAHGIGSGADSGQLWARAVYAITATVVGGLCVRRALWEPKAANQPKKAGVPRRIDPRTHALSGLLATPAAGQHDENTTLADGTCRTR
ncbi:MAG: ferric reductase-like transmembrane domain-containing protein [Chloroflexota bacterium]|nr:ferric reductase-like transmembrane domain-containing protein [Chloroflexota bacterium]